MDMTEYITRMRNLNHVAGMISREKEQLIKEMMMHLDYYPGDKVHITTSRKDRLRTGQYLVHGVSISFCGNYLDFDLQARDGTLYTHQVLLEKLKDNVKLISRDGLPVNR